MKDAPAEFAAASGAARLLLALLTLRWLAGIAEPYTIGGLSQAAALALLAGSLTIFLQRMAVSGPAALLVAGLLAWQLSGAMTWAVMPEPDPVKALALMFLLGLYASFSNAAMQDLAEPAALPPLRRFLTAFVVVGAALSVQQVVTGTGFVEAGKDWLTRAYGSDVHPVSFAIQLLAAFVGLEVIRLKLGEPVTPGHVAIGLLAASALYLTYARTGWMMALVTAGYAVLARSGPQLRFLLVAAGSAAAWAMVHLSGRFTDLQSLPFFLEHFSFSNVVFDYRYIDNSVSWRIVNWAYGLQQALQTPLLGHGPGQSAETSRFGLEMHNLFLETFFEGGIFGLAAALLVVFGLLRLHRLLPVATLADRRARALCNGLGVSLLLAVTFSTSLVDQLMTFLLYICALAAASSASVETGEMPVHPPVAHANTLA